MLQYWCYHGYFTVIHILAEVTEWKWIERLRFSDFVLCPKNNY